MDDKKLEKAAQKAIKEEFGRKDVCIKYTDAAEIYEEMRNYYYPVKPDINSWLSNEVRGVDFEYDRTEYMALYQEDAAEWMLITKTEYQKLDQEHYDKWFEVWEKERL